MIVNQLLCMLKTYLSGENARTRSVKINLQICRRFDALSLGESRKMKVKKLWRSVIHMIVAQALGMTISLGLFAGSTELFEPDHYISYDIQTARSQRHHIKLRDQFIDWTAFAVGKPIKLLNPTLKRHNNQVFEIKNPALHYTGYELEYAHDIHISANVLVVNQFGSFFLDEFRPDRLLTPAQKRHLTPLATDNEAIIADHYLCYEIPPFEVTTEFGFLKDQFRSKEFQNLVARRFCNPAAKLHNDKVYDIVNDVSSNHLMCFEMDKERIHHIVDLLDQFGIKKAFVHRDDELCVPSYKIELPDDCEGSAPNDDGICNGLCPHPNDICRPDSTNQHCACFRTEPLPCSSTFPDNNGQCDGQCPEGEICVNHSGEKCECRPLATPCGITPDGQCGGSCTGTDEVCSFIPGTDICRCLLFVHPLSSLDVCTL